mmetsp:Transcript_84241/g.247103  ORF Transcript_84241/g.247103 Transcript_84241/m.247103 type:complete len:200 (-) Transcript_84241:388-987(-)
MTPASDSAQFTVQGQEGTSIAEQLRKSEEVSERAVAGAAPSCQTPALGRSSLLIQEGNGITCRGYYISETVQGPDCLIAIHRTATLPRSPAFRSARDRIDGNECRSKTHHLGVPQKSAFSKVALPTKLAPPPALRSPSTRIYGDKRVVVGKHICEALECILCFVKTSAPIFWMSKAAPGSRFRIQEHKCVETAKDLIET